MATKAELEQKIKAQNNWLTVIAVVGILLILCLIISAISLAYITGQSARAENRVVEDPVVEDSVIEEPEVDEVDEPVVEVVTNSPIELSHLAYWTTATEADRWPELSEFDIVACHGDPDENGNAKIVFLIGEIQKEDLVLTYFNAYKGTWSESVKQQIITEIQDSVRPHVPGFTLTNVEIVHLNN